MKRDLIRRNYGIYIIAIWSLVLGGQNLSRLLIISASLQGLGSSAPSPLYGVYQGVGAVSAIFSLGFFAAAIGLWRIANWGRILFLVTVISFFIVSTIGLFAPELSNPTIGQKWILGIRYALSAFLPLAYLNLEPVKTRFKPTFEEDSDYE